MQLSVSLGVEYAQLCDRNRYARSQCVLDALQRLDEVALGILRTRTAAGATSSTSASGRATSTVCGLEMELDLEAAELESSCGGAMRPSPQLSCMTDEEAAGTAHFITEVLPLLPPAHVLGKGRDSAEGSAEASVSCRFGPFVTLVLSGHQRISSSSLATLVSAWAQHLKAVQHQRCKNDATASTRSTPGGDDAELPPIVQRVGLGCSGMALTSAEFLLIAMAVADVSRTAYAFGPAVDGSKTSLLPAYEELGRERSIELFLDLSLNEGLLQSASSRDVEEPTSRRRAPRCAIASACDSLRLAVAEGQPLHPSPFISLRHLDLRGCAPDTTPSCGTEVSPSSIRALAELVPQLFDFRISHCPGLFHDAADGPRHSASLHLLTEILSSPNLRRLDLGFCRLGQECGAGLQANLIQLLLDASCELQWLNLRGNCLHTGALAEIVLNCTDLQVLFLGSQQPASQRTPHSSRWIAQENDVLSLLLAIEQSSSLRVVDITGLGPLHRHQVAHVPIPSRSPKRRSRLVGRTTTGATGGAGTRLRVGTASRPRLVGGKLCVRSASGSSTSTTSSVRSRPRTTSREEEARPTEAYRALESIVTHNVVLRRLYLDYPGDGDGCDRNAWMDSLASWLAVRQESVTTIEIDVVEGFSDAALLEDQILPYRSRSAELVVGRAESDACTTTTPPRDDVPIRVESPFRRRQKEHGDDGEGGLEVSVGDEPHAKGGDETAIQEEEETTTREGAVGRDTTRNNGVADAHVGTDDAPLHTRGARRTGEETEDVYETEAVAGEEEVDDTDEEPHLTPMPPATPIARDHEESPSSSSATTTATSSALPSALQAQLDDWKEETLGLWMKGYTDLALAYERAYNQQQQQVSIPTSRTPSISSAIEATNEEEQVPTTEERNVDGSGEDRFTEEEGEEGLDHTEEVDQTVSSTIPKEEIEYEEEQGQPAPTASILQEEEERSSGDVDTSAEVQPGLSATGDDDAVGSDDDSITPSATPPTPTERPSRRSHSTTTNNSPPTSEVAEQVRELSKRERKLLVREALAEARLIEARAVLEEHYSTRSLRDELGRQLADSSQQRLVHDNTSAQMTTTGTSMDTPDAPVQHEHSSSAANTSSRAGPPSSLAEDESTSQSPPPPPPPPPPGKGTGSALEHENAELHSRVEMLTRELEKQQGRGSRPQSTSLAANTVSSTSINAADNSAAIFSPGRPLPHALEDQRRLADTVAAVLTLPLDIAVSAYPLFGAAVSGLSSHEVFSLFQAWTNRMNGASIDSHKEEVLYQLVEGCATRNFFSNVNEFGAVSPDSTSRRQPRDVRCLLTPSALLQQSREYTYLRKEAAAGPLSAEDRERRLQEGHGFVSEYVLPHPLHVVLAAFPRFSLAYSQLSVTEKESFVQSWMLRFVPTSKWVPHPSTPSPSGSPDPRRSFGSPSSSVPMYDRESPDALRRSLRAASEATCGRQPSLFRLDEGDTARRTPSSGKEGDRYWDLHDVMCTCFHNGLLR